jgi:hypothetical protein
MDGLGLRTTSRRVSSWISREAKQDSKRITLLLLFKSIVMLQRSLAAGLACPSTLTGWLRYSVSW